MADLRIFPVDDNREFLAPTGKLLPDSSGGPDNAKSPADAIDLLETVTDQASATLLVVDDEIHILKLVAHVLRSNGYRVLEAVNGQDALRVVEEFPEDLQMLVTDVVMPHLGGVGLAEQMSLRYPNIRVLFLSGYTDDKALRQELMNGKIDFLQKPFSPTALATKVRMVLDR